MKKQEKMDVSKELVDVLRSTGKSRPVEDYPVLQVYLQDTGFYPFVKSYVESPMSNGDIIEKLNQFNPEQIFCKEEIDIKTDTKKILYLFIKIAPGYYMELSSNMQILDDYDEQIREHLRKLSNSDMFAFVSYMSMLCPPPSSKLYSRQLENKILNIVKSIRLKSNTVTPSIGMICQEDGQFYTKDFYINGNYKLVEGDLHYGKGFMEFHEKLLKRLSEDSKGLILLHGIPGSGKTFFCRCLIKDLMKMNKFVIYLPPSMMEFMTSPEMISYISQIAMEKYDDGKKCIILLEDAEPLIQSRTVGGRSDGITNLLNMTDGLLNDILNVQVIATFNTDLKNIDSALLRPERLLARKEFKKLRVDDVKKLLKFLKMDKEINEECTLAEIYSQHKHSEILVHEYNSTTPKMGYIK